MLIVDRSTLVGSLPAPHRAVEARAASLQKPARLSLVAAGERESSLRKIRRRDLEIEGGNLEHELLFNLEKNERGARLSPVAACERESSPGKIRRGDSEIEGCDVKNERGARLSLVAACERESSLGVGDLTIAGGNFESE